MSLMLCVLLWPHPGTDDLLVAYEDRVLSLLPAHGGRVVQRVRRDGPGEGPFEVQIIEVPDEASLNAYLSDPERTAAADLRDRAIARTELMRVTPATGG